MKNLRSVLAASLLAGITLASPALFAAEMDTPPPHFFKMPAPSGQMTTQVAPDDHKLSLPYAWWSYPSAFTKLETDLKITADPGINSPWFLSHQFSLVDSGGASKSQGYIGLQAATGGTGQKGIIFSIWDATSATAGTDATCQPFGGEGVGMQCFKTFAWSAGKTYRLRIVNDRGVYSGYVIDMSTTPATETLLGKIQAPAGVAGFGRESVQWAEYYGVSLANCADYPFVKAVWTRPQGDSGASVAGNLYLNYGDTYCKNSTVAASGTDIFMDGGTPAPNSRRHMLTSAGKYIYAESTSLGCGGGGLKPNGAAIANCTSFARVTLAGGKVALQAENGTYLSCTNGGGSTTTATARGIGNNESFTETTSSSAVSYKSYGGKYLTAVNYGTVDFKCSAYYAGSTEKFTPVINKARTASVTVSSESISTAQQGVKAIDGAVNGYPGDHSREWATNGEGAGAWIQLKWSATTAVKTVRLYDRPNMNDQITSGTLLFSNGTSIAVPALPNDGSGLNVSFSSKSVTWVKFRVDQTIGNVGLAEIEVY